MPIPAGDKRQLFDVPIGTFEFWKIKLKHIYHLFKRMAAKAPATTKTTLEKYIDRKLGNFFVATTPLHEINLQLY